MKKNTYTNLLVWLSINSLLLINCYPGSPLSEREKCYKKEYCSTAVSDCLVGSALLGTMLTTPTASSYAASSPNNISEYESNDTFSSSGSAYLSSSYSYVSISGSMSTDTDVDIFSTYYSSYSPSSFPLSMTSGTATCQAYTRGSQSIVSNATIDSTFTSLGTLSITPIQVSLNSSTSSYLYVKCTGTSGSNYEIKYDLSAYSTAPAGASLSPLTNILLLSCVDAKRSCITYCNNKHAF